MYLVIEGVNEIYLIQKPDYKLLIEYLENVSHYRYDKLGKAYASLGLEKQESTLKFQDCVSLLKKLGYIPEDKIFISILPSQNIEEDEIKNETERKQSVNENENENKSKKEKIKQKKSMKKQNKMAYKMTKDRPNAMPIPKDSLARLRNR